MDFFREKKYFLCGICVAIVTSSVAAAAGFSNIGGVVGRSNDKTPAWCKENSALGWSFYCDDRKYSRHDQRAQHGKGPSVAASTAHKTAKDAVKRWQNRLEEAKAKAILEPTMDNITAYLTLEKQTLEKASAFAEKAQKTLWQHPGLDYSVQYPQGHLAHQVWMRQHQKIVDNTIRNSAKKRFGIFFFYRSSSPYSKVYAPILKAYGRRYGLKIIAVSLDGKGIVGFPKFVTNGDQFTRWRLANIVPATVLFDDTTKRAIPIGYGILTQDQLSRRLFAVLAKGRNDAP